MKVSKREEYILRIHFHITATIVSFNFSLPFYSEHMCVVSYKYINDGLLFTLLNQIFLQIFLKKILREILRDIYNLSVAVASRIEQQSAISFEKTKNKNFY